MMQVTKVWWDGEKLMAEPIDPASVYKEDSTCNKTLLAQGKAYPRTCRKCGLGPCIADRVQPAPVQEPVDTLIAAWQALEETSGHVLDVGDVEGRMHMSVIRSAWEQMDSLVREIWDERGRS